MEFIEVSLADAKFWSVANKGDWRGDMWSDVVKKAEATGGTIRWYAIKEKRHSKFPHGALDVVKVKTNRIRTRVRK